MKSGVNEGGSIEFFMEDDAAIRREAMSKAVENALANAKAYAAGANVKIADVIEIDGNNWSGGGFAFGQGGGFNVGRDSTSVAASELRVSQSVRIVCGY